MTNLNQRELEAYAALTKFWVATNFPLEIPTFRQLCDRKPEHSGPRFAIKECYIFRTHVIRIPIQWSYYSGTGIKMALTHDAVVFYYYFKSEIDDMADDWETFATDNMQPLVAVMFDNSPEIHQWFCDQLPDILADKNNFALYLAMSATDQQVTPHKLYLPAGESGRYTDANKMYAAGDIQSLWKFINLVWIDVKTLSVVKGVYPVVNAGGARPWQYWSDGARTKYYMLGSVMDISVNKSAGQAIQWLLASGTLTVDTADINELRQVTDIKETIIEQKKVGGTGNGQSVTLYMSRFMVNDKQIRSYLRVSSEEWSLGGDGDYDETTSLFNERDEADIAYKNSASLLA